MFPTSAFLSGLKSSNSNNPPNTPQNIMPIIAEVTKLIPRGENLSRKSTLESIGPEKNKVTIAPNAIISP